jgi:signal transduction histidine kinase
VVHPIGPATTVLDHEDVIAMSTTSSASPPPALPAPPRSTAARPGREWLDAVLRAPVSGRTWRAYLFLLVAAPLALAAFAALAVSAFVGGLLSVTVIGIPLLSLVVRGARGYGAIPRGLARGLLGVHVEAPRRRRPTGVGFLPWLRASLGDLDGWRAIAYIVVSLPLALVGVYVVALVLGVSMTLLTYPVWWQLFDPVNTDAAGVVHHAGLQFGDTYIDTWPEALGVSVLGAGGLFVAPWIARTLTGAAGLLVRGLLGPTRIAERVDDLEVTRARAVDDSAAALRRIERDLHDGTQARLVALAMHLDMAKEKLGDGPDETMDPGEVARARALLDEAHRNATEAIIELREVTRSIHPPALDRGLDEALATLAARNGVPTQVRTALAVRPSPAIETIAYFCVAELLTNVAKHGEATAATVDVRDEGGRLRLQVTDDGRGGAHVAPGGGLAGLAERVRTVDGTLAVSSPPDGPTVVSLDLPLGA